jgi:hypothetical protein
MSPASFNFDIPSIPFSWNMRFVDGNTVGSGEDVGFVRFEVTGRLNPDLVDRLTIFFDGSGVQGGSFGAPGSYFFDTSMLAEDSSSGISIGYICCEGNLTGFTRLLLPTAPEFGFSFQIPIFPASTFPPDFSRFPPTLELLLRMAVLDEDGNEVDVFGTSQALSFAVDEPSTWALFAFGILSLATGRFNLTNARFQQ